jgi:hypothetical protein
MKPLILLLLLSLPTFATISGSTVWEVRPTVGNDTNGGGFVTGASGTDFSQQNAKNSGGNNSSETDAVAVGTTTITSATASFTAAIVGNIVFFSGGTGTITAQWRQVATFVNGTTITIDASIAASTGMTMNIGGALATPAQAYTNAISSNTIWGKATASYTVTSAQTLAGQNGQPITFIGYTTTRGDNGQFTWTTATNSIDLFTFSNAYNYVFQNVIFSTTAGTPGDGFHASAGGGTSGLVHFVNCSLQGFAVAILGNFSATESFVTIIVENTEIKTSVAQGIFNDGVTVVLGSYIHDNGTDGIATENAIGQVTGPLFVAHSIIKSNGANGINYNVNTGSPINSAYIWPILLNNAIINNTNDGIRLNVNAPGQPGSIIAWNNIIDSNGGFGINGVGTPPLGIGLTSFLSNAYRANTSGNQNNFSAGTGDVALSADPFVSRGGNNFALNSTAGGGTACKGAGFPGVLQIGGTGHIDIGPLQSSGGGGSTAPSASGFVGALQRKETLCLIGQHSVTTPIGLITGMVTIPADSKSMATASICAEQ